MSMQSKSKRLNVKLEEKIEIFKRFSQTHQKITGSTVFENYPIGRWAVQIRSQIKHIDKNNQINPTKEQLEELNNLGILDRQIEAAIDEKIDILVEWLKNHPKIKIIPKASEDILKEYASTDEEYEKITKEYEKMNRYYNYIRHRKYQNKLTEKQYKKCKDGNIGGVFGYSTQVEELSKKYEKNEDDIDYIIRTYGTIDNFKDLYRKKKLNKEDNEFAKFIIKNVVDIDFNNNSREYDRLYCAIYGRPDTNTLDIYSSEKLKKMLESLTPNEKYVIERRFGLISRDIPNNLKTLGAELNKSKEGIRVIEEKALRKLRFEKYKVENKCNYNLNEIINSEFINAEEKQKIEKFEDNMYESDILISNNPKKEDIEYQDILRNIEIIKKIDNLGTEKRKQEEEKQAMHNNDTIYDLEHAKIEKERLEEELRNLREEIKKAKELLYSYNKLVDEDKETDMETHD